jgi:hypothetical protein
MKSCTKTESKSNSHFALIPFREKEILCITKDSKRYIVPKQICENLGISWSGQFERLKRDAVLNDAIRVIRIPQKNPSGKGNIDQETVCLPIEYLNGWLFGIDDSRVKTENREAVITYKKECYIVLYEYFQKGASIDINRLEEDIELQDFLYRKIRQARTSERSLWERVKKAFADGSTDYDPSSELANKFYALTQDKIHYAVTNKIAAELVYERIENNPTTNFGMTAFDKDRKIKKHDLQTGKNYLGEQELLQYENIGEQLLLRIELRILRGGKITMEEWFFEINRLLQENNYPILFDYKQPNHKSVFRFIGTSQKNVVLGRNVVEIRGSS